MFKYLANSAGYDKLSGNERLTKIEGIINEFLESCKVSSGGIKYIEDNIDKIYEPFQFISTMSALQNYLPFIILIFYNPIL